MEDRFKIYTSNEQKVGNEFSSLFNQKYICNNKSNILNVDGKINNIFVELQNLKYKKALSEKSFIIDTISVFYFKKMKRRKISLLDNDIEIKKMGKLYTLNDNDLYLIYINKNDVIQYKDYYSKFLNSENYIFLPIKISKIKEDCKRNTIFVNDKSRLTDTWESAYQFYDQNDKYFYSKEELMSLFNSNKELTPTHN